MSAMMVTFAVQVPAGEDVDNAEMVLVDSAEYWVLMAVLSGTFDPMPPITTERTQIAVFDDSTMKNQTVTLLEAKVEIGG